MDQDAKKSFCPLRFEINWTSAAQDLGPVQTSNFTCAESNANEKNLLISLISIRFGTCEVRRLNRALENFAMFSVHRVLYTSAS